MLRFTIFSLSLLIWVFYSVVAYGQIQSPYFTSHPTLSPDGETIIFSYESDLWKVPAKGGTASRITAMDGTETRPSVSPDGKWIVFSSNQYGNMDLYRMPFDGGEIEQLTWHQAVDEMEGWSWDSKTIYFTSSRENRFSSWQMPSVGGTPSRVFSHYHNNDHNLAVHPNGTAYFNTSWESKNQAHRKRYRGAFAPQIESYHPESGEYTVHTEFNGKDMWPTIDREGNVYFVSDEYNGEYNLFRLNGDLKERHTDFDTSIKHPKVSDNGERVVFTRDYQTWLFDVDTGEANPVEISLSGNSTLEKDQDFKTEGNITDFDVSPDKKKIAFASRGELFVSDADGKFIRQLSTDINGRVMEVKWLNDNKTLIFSQTFNGYQNWFRIGADGNDTESNLTSEDQNNRALALNNDRTQGVYLSGRGEVRLMDIETGESRTIVEDEIWDIFSSSPSFSPDGRYVLFTSFRNFEQSIFLYDIRENRTIAITDTYVSETNPFFSPDGKYIYFQTNRTQPSYPYGMKDSDIYRIALDTIQPEFRSDRFAELFDEEELVNGDDESGSDKQAVEVTVNEQGLRDRWERVGPDFGSQTSPYVTIDDEKTIFLYRSNHDEEKFAWWKTVFEPFEPPKTEKIDGTEMDSGQIIGVDDSNWLLMGGDIYKMDVSKSTVEKIDISYTFRRNIRDEFTQMFDEMWANFEVNFYDEEFHGQNWSEIREHYRQFLPHVRTRENLRELKNDMLGELNTSHIGFSSSGDEEEVYFGSVTQSTGILFDADEPYVVQRIITQSPASFSNTSLQPGDRLIRVNGKVIDPAMNREFYFSTPSMDSEMTLSLSRNNIEFDLKLEPASYFSTRNLLYEEWINKRQQLVDDQSDKQIAYVHMKNMGGGELQNFLEEMVSEGESRDALILDLRYNTGGNVHDDVLKYLKQSPYLNWNYRGGAKGTQSNFTPAAKPIVLLINEPSLSDAEMAAAGFKELGLGTVIGTETYRWIIFTSGRGLVDGSFYRLPSWGVYTLDGDNLEKTGVKPDIEVFKTFEDKLNGEDPQLDYAIRHILDALKE